MTGSGRRGYYQAAGRRSRASGLQWEQLIDAACRHYASQGTAAIEKTPEPMKPVSRPNQKGQFTACFTKKAQPDYQGTLKDGRSVVFEAKHTGSGRMQRSAISEEQEKQLDRHSGLGAACFVLVSFGDCQCFRVPWEAFRDMKEHFGRAYVRPDDLSLFKVEFRDGVPMFLDNL